MLVPDFASHACSERTMSYASASASEENPQCCKSRIVVVPKIQVLVGGTLVWMAVP